MVTPALMSGLLASTYLADRLRGIRQGFLDECAETHGTAVVIGIAALCAALLVARRIERHKRGEVPPPDYVGEIARVLGLSVAELADVRAIAAQAGLSQAAVVLLSPANLAYAVQAAAVDRDAGRRARLDALSVRLFGTHLPQGGEGTGNGEQGTGNRQQGTNGHEGRIPARQRAATSPKFRDLI